jgi:hypothetical protein
MGRCAPLPALRIEASLILPAKLIIIEKNPRKKNRRDPLEHPRKQSPPGAGFEPQPCLSAGHRATV